MRQAFQRKLGLMRPTINPRRICSILPESPSFQTAHVAMHENVAQRPRSAKLHA
jgi:hypothetical protein